WSALGSPTLEVINEKPNSWMLDHAPLSRTATNSTIIAGATSAISVSPPRKTRSPRFCRLARRRSRGNPWRSRGIVGSSSSMLATVMYALLRAPLLLVRREHRLSARGHAFELLLHQRDEFLGE